MALFENSGACYTLHEDVIHSNIAKPGTALTIVRGPTRKPRAKRLNNATGAKYEKASVANESDDTRRKHMMTPGRFGHLRDMLADLKVI